MDPSLIGVLVGLAWSVAAIGFFVGRQRRMAAAWRAGQAAFRARKFPDAELCFRTSLALADRRFGARHWRTAFHLAALSDALVCQKRVDDAAPYISRALAIHDALRHQPHPAIVLLLVSAYNYEHVKGDTARATALLDRARREAGSRAMVAAVEGAVARHAMVQGQWQQAADAMCRPGVARPDREDIRRLTAIARECERAGDLGRATACLGVALSNVDKTKPRPHVSAFFAGLLGAALARAGRHADARDHLSRAIEGYERSVGESHPVLALVLVPFAEACAELGDLPAARAACERAIPIATPGESPADPYRAPSVTADPLAPERLRARALMERIAQVPRP